MKGLAMRKMMRFFVVLAFVLMVPRLAMSQVLVYGEVDEQDYTTPIENATVTFSGVDVAGDTVVYQLVTDSLGYFADSINAGVYRVWASAEGYQTEYQSDSLEIVEGEYFFGLYFSLYEIYHPVRYVAARQFTNDLVRITWSMHDPLLYEDFESGNFDRFPWNNTISDHPWTIDSLHAYEGQYCMKSTCEGESNGVSQIEVSVYVPIEGQLSFYCKISSENPWDIGHFYLDGVKKMECAGEEGWNEHQFDITVGEHVFRWNYVKDASTDVGDDCFYVDCIHFYQEDSTKATRSFQYYDLFRSRFEEEPVMMASHLTDTVFMDMNWGSLPWGQYRWGVSRYYEGNRGNSDTIWSAYLDKDMTTTLEIQGSTNVGLPPSGATVSLSSHDGQGHDYQATLDANGHLLMPVYRDEYDVRMYLDGYMDYVSDSAVSIFAPTQLEIELEEAMPGVDSLYVSYTGWAIWSMEEVPNRDLQYYEIMLNGEAVGTTTATTFQFDVSQLNEGDLCTAQVRPVYLSGTCDWKSCQWMYRPCSNFMGSTNMVWTLNNEDILLSWVYPEGDLLGAMLFRDGVFLGFTEEDTFLDETVELHGEVTYCLHLVYDGDLDGTYYSMSCEQCATAAFPAYCDPPVKLDGIRYYEDDEDHGALVSWGERPEPINQWLHFDNGEFKRSLGGDDEPRIFWAIRFEAEDLAEYVGSALKKVMLYDVGAGTYQLWIYVGGDTAPRNLVRSQNMALTNAQAWHEETISPAYDIPENEPIWIVVGQQGLSRPAAACQDMGDANGRWVSLDGATWTDMHTFNMHYTWMLRAFITNQAGREMALDKEGYILQQYNLYRSFDNTDYQLTASIPAIDGQLYYEYRDNLAEDDHEDVYYRLTAFYLADDGETCESDFAATLNNPDQNYVAIDLTATDEYQALEFKLYPNPTSGQITIALEGMQKVQICNTLGQVLLVRQVKSNVVLIDLSAFESGVYWLQVATQNTVTSKAFILSR
jgi:hypothetical protein